MRAPMRAASGASVATAPLLTVISLPSINVLVPDELKPEEEAIATQCNSNQREVPHAIILPSAVMRSLFGRQHRIFRTPDNASRFLLRRRSGGQRDRNHDDHAEHPRYEGAVQVRIVRA